jgi:ribosomal-protein-alanine N-acetyltransferase
VSDWTLAPMREDDLDAVLAIEADMHPHPWTAGNFRDTLASGYDAQVLRLAEEPAVAGYVVLMPVVDEAHLLNVTVRRDLQGRRFGKLLLDAVVAKTRGWNMTSILLEVRPSNVRAAQVYQRYGFAEIGRRRGYYPAAGGTREDAVVMRLVL